MTTGDQKLRIVLAIFDRARALGSAIGELASADIAVTCLGLIVLAKTAGELATDASSPGTHLKKLPPLLTDLAPLPGAPCTGGILASPCLVRPWLSGWQMPALWSNNRTDGAPPHLAADLERHVQKGAAILAVLPETARQQWLCTRILLAQSSASVLALECSLPTMT